MDEVFAKAEELISDVKKYVDNRVSVVKLKAAEKISEAGSTIITVVIVTAFLVFFLAFASIALGYAFSKWTGEYYWGFLIVAGIYLLLGLIILAAKDKIIRLPLLNSLLTLLFKNHEED